MKFAELVNLWKVDARAETSPGWKSTQDQMIRDYFPLLQTKKVTQIKPIDILRVLNQMKELEYGDQTRLHAFNLLFSIFDSAVNLFDLIKENPVLVKFKPKVTTEEPSYLVPEHAHMLLAHSIGDNFELAIFINLLCGLRVGEIQGLTWEDSFDEAKADLIIKQHWCRKSKTMAKKTKNKKEHRVPIPELLMRRLKACQDKTGFITKVNGSMMNHSSFHKAIKRMCKALYIPEVSSHGLRHSCGEIWFEKGASLLNLTKLLNHSSEKSTRRYVHHSDKQLKEIAKTITGPDKRKA